MISVRMPVFGNEILSGPHLLYKTDESRHLTQAFRKRANILRYITDARQERHLTYQAARQSVIKHRTDRFEGVTASQLL
jgi:glutamine amidotransferase-like uncharacterized protein